MPFEPRPLTGTLWQNKSDNPRAPVLRGSIYDEQCNEVRVSAWWVTDRETGAKRLDRDGNPFLSLKLELPEDKPQRKSAPPAQDDMPF